MGRSILAKIDHRRRAKRSVIAAVSVTGALGTSPVGRMATGSSRSVLAGSTVR